MLGNASAKDALRNEMRAKLRAMPATEIENTSARIRSQLSFKPGEKVAFFAGLPTEPRLLELLTEFPQTLWHLPRVTGRSTMQFVQIDSTSHLRPGAFKILQPPPGPITTDFETILCPGIAFTKNGGRLGQGGGFHDRFLSGQPRARFIGIAFQFQLIDSIPSDEHDIFMHQIVTS